MNLALAPHTFEKESGSRFCVSCGQSKDNARHTPRRKIFTRKLPDGAKVGALDVQLLHRICNLLWAAAAAKAVR